MSVTKPKPDIRLGDLKLEEVVDADSLRQVARSFFDLFGLSIRIYEARGTLLAEASEEPAIHTYLAEFEGGQMALEATSRQLRAIRPDEETVRHTAFSGESYAVLPLRSQSRTVGKVIIGPFLPAGLSEMPKTLERVDPDIDRIRARDELGKMVRIREETLERLCAHLSRMLNLLVYSNHRAQLTSEMHVATIRSNYRELAEKTANLEAAYECLKELDRLKSNFLATVSHELRTPLTSIIGYSEMLQEGIAGELAEEQRDFVDTIHRKGEHLLALISSLLDLSRLEQGVLKLNVEEIDVAELVRSVEETFVPAARDKGVDLEVVVSDDLPALMGDTLRLKQVLSNLIENALKFTPAGGRVSLLVERRQQNALGRLGASLLSSGRDVSAFVVHDTGEGMPADELNKIFDAFYQVDGGSTREHGGTGLGLSIVKRLVDAHGGEVSVTTELGKGSEFVVTIPEPE